MITDTQSVLERLAVALKNRQATAAALKIARDDHNEAERIANGIFLEISVLWQTGLDTELRKIGAEPQSVFETVNQ